MSNTIDNIAVKDFVNNIALETAEALADLGAEALQLYKRMREEVDAINAAKYYDDIARIHIVLHSLTCLFQSYHRRREFVLGDASEIPHLKDNDCFAQALGELYHTLMLLATEDVYGDIAHVLDRYLKDRPDGVVVKHQTVSAALYEYFSRASQMYETFTKDGNKLLNRMEHVYDLLEIWLSIIHTVGFSVSEILLLKLIAKRKHLEEATNALLSKALIRTIQGAIDSGDAKVFVETNEDLDSETATQDAKPKEGDAIVH